MVNSACLIFNAGSGQNDSQQILAKIRSILEPAIALDIYELTPELDLKQRVKEAIAKGADAIIGAGGDGTISAVAEATIQSGVPLGVIPTGTANAFASALQIPSNLEAACRTILEGNTRSVDGAVCNGQVMILLAGIGFEAETVERSDLLPKKSLGVFAYIWAGIKQLQNLHRFKVKIETDTQKISTTASAVTIANVAPSTSILAQGPSGVIGNDGLLDLTIVTPKGILGAIAAFTNLLGTALLNKSAQHEAIKYLRSRQVRVTATPPQKVVVDGETIGTTPVEVECLPAGLTVFTPR
jgi:YegS/Rv2252/BmrU family lipid kinase